MPKSSAEHLQMPHPLENLRGLGFMPGTFQQWQLDRFASGSASEWCFFHLHWRKYDWVIFHMMYQYVYIYIYIYYDRSVIIATTVQYHCHYCLKIYCNAVLQCSILYILSCIRLSSCMYYITYAYIYIYVYIYVYNCTYMYILYIHILAHYKQCSW